MTTTAQLKVMVVDDDRVALEVAGERLEDAGYRVVLRRTEMGTSVAILREIPDIVLLDVNMPALRGDTIARMLDNRTYNKPIILLHSSEPRARLRELAQACGAAGFIEKTHDAALFIGRLRAAVDAARA